MDIALITGSAGLIGAEATSFFVNKGFKVVGIDNDMRKYFFGQEASTDWKPDENTSQITVHAGVWNRLLFLLRAIGENFFSSIQKKFRLSRIQQDADLTERHQPGVGGETGASESNIWRGPSIDYLLHIVSGDKFPERVMKEVLNAG